MDYMQTISVLSTLKNNLDSVHVAEIPPEAFGNALELAISVLSDSIWRSCAEEMPAKGWVPPDDDDLGYFRSVPVLVESEDGIVAACYEEEAPGVKGFHGWVDVHDGHDVIGVTKWRPMPPSEDEIQSPIN